MIKGNVGRPEIRTLKEAGIEISANTIKQLANYLNGKETKAAYLAGLFGFDTNTANFDIFRKTDKKEYMISGGEMTFNAEIMPYLPLQFFSMKKLVRKEWHGKENKLNWVPVTALVVSYGKESMQVGSIDDLFAYAYVARRLKPSDDRRGKAFSMALEVENLAERGRSYFYMATLESALVMQDGQRYAIVNAFNYTDMRENADPENAVGIFSITKNEWAIPQR